MSNPNNDFGTEDNSSVTDVRNCDSGSELITVKSEYERLLEEIAELKALITSLTAERDELKYHICRDLAAEYNSRIGDIELRVMNAKLRVLELKRMVEIIQAQINRQERKSEKKAREQAHREFREFEEELNRMAEEARNANQYREDESRKEEEWQQEQEEREKKDDEDREDTSRVKYKSRSDEMKALYRKIVKALHPDMNPDETEQEKEMFRDAVAAYNNGDLDKLREIAAMIDEGNLGNEMTGTPEDIEKLKEIIEGLRMRVEELREEIELIKSSFPYTMKEFLADEEAVSRKQKELTDLLYEYSMQEKELDERLDSLLGRNNGKKGKE